MIATKALRREKFKVPITFEFLAQPCHAEHGESPVGCAPSWLVLPLAGRPKRASAVGGGGITIYELRFTIYDLGLKILLIVYLIVCSSN